jgi:uncharacterized protein YlzI (FlbEa/FlbD family)
MAVTKWSIGRNKQRPYAISLNESALSKETKIPRKATTALAALLVFGAASVVWADANSRTDGSFAQRPVSIGAVNDAAKSFNTERASFAASQLAPARGGTTGRMTAWIKLTEPGGKPIHINVQHVTSVRSDTQIPGARAQLDLTSGKFQGVQENVEQVMQLISATPGARENDETPSAAL